MSDQRNDFVPIPGFLHYEINRQGVVRSKDRTLRKTDGSVQPRKGRILSPGRGSHGYLTVSLHENGKGTSHCIHRLVATSFLGIQDGKEVNHIDGNKMNNNLSNLEWVTRQQNTRHAFDHGLAKTGKAHHSFKGSIVAVNATTGETFKMSGTKEITSRGFNHRTIYRIANGKSCCHKGHYFYWERDFDTPPSHHPIDTTPNQYDALGKGGEQ